MSSHDEYAALLDAFLDGELSEEEAGEVRVHLSECADCQAYVADALAIRDAFPDIGETVVPDGFAESVLAALPPRPVSWRVQWAKVVLPLAACAALVILLHGIAGRRATTGGGASMSSSVTADMDAGGAAFDDADAVPPQAPEAALQSVQNTTAEETEPDMIPFSIRSSGTEVPEEAEEESVSNGSAAPAAAKAIPDGYAVEEAFPGEAPATKELPDEAPATGTVPGEGAATDAGAVSDRGTTTENVPDAESKTEDVPDAGTVPDRNAVTEDIPDVDAVEDSLPAPEPGVNEVRLFGESGANGETEQDATADLSAGTVSVWTLPAAALDLFDDYAPAEKTESGIWYALTPGEFDTLSRKLAGMQLEIVPGADAPPPTARPGMEYVFVPL